MNDEQFNECVCDIATRMEATMINCIRKYRHFEFDPVDMRTSILQTFVITHLGHIIRESLWKENPEQLCENFIEHLNHNLINAISSITHDTVN